MRNRLLRLLVVLGVVAVLAAGVAYLYTNTDWGRDQVRKRLVALIQGNSHGLVSIGRVSGNLLDGITAHDVIITDSARRPLLKADEIWTRYNLSTLRGKRIELHEVRLVRPIIVLDKLPGGKWNYDRIFPRDTMTSAGRRKTGWGTWIRFSNVTILDGDMTVRTPWQPDVNLTGAERDDAVRRSLGPDGRLELIKVAGGYQKVSSFHRINALLPLVRLEDPGYRNKLVEVAALKMIAQPFRPPVADVRGLTGTFEFTGDSLWWRGARAALPGTRMTGDGRYYINNGNLHLQLHGDPVSPADLRWAVTRLPERGSGKLDFGMHWTGDKSVYQATNMDVRLEGSHIAGQIEVTVTDTLAYRNANLRFSSLDTRLLSRLFPDIRLPFSGLLAGRAKFDGGQHSLLVDGDLTVDDRASGRSRVAAVGVLGLDKGVFNARDLRVRMMPLQTGLAEAFVRDLPLGGTLMGTAVLNGSTASTMVARGDVTHVERGARSRAVGRAAFRADGLGWLDIDAQMRPLSLVTVGRFMPAVGLRGTATGPVRLKGPMSNLAVNSALTFSDGGFLDMRGTLDLASRQKGYDVSLQSRLFNANAIIAKAPRTSVTAVATARGRGFDPATMQASITASVSTSSFDTVAIDRANVRVAIANGLARFDTLAVELPEGIIEAKGSFGLAPGRSGTLTYHVAIDSLSRIASLVSPDTAGIVPPRPGILARRVARARADSLRIARATEVERAVTGQRMPPIVVDTPAVVRMSEVSGSARADGVAIGNIRNFSLRGTASGENIVARGNTVGAFAADYDWINARTTQSQVRVNATGRSVRALGFDLDSVGAKLGYKKPFGTAEIVVHQDDARNYAANAQFTLNKVRSELRLNDLKLRFDTTVWSSTRVAALHWGEAGVDVDNLELRNSSNGRIYVNGLLPKEGNANLDVAVENLEVADVIALTQSGIDAKGLISFNVHATGTLEDPRFKGVFGATSLTYNGTVVPEVHGHVDYANQTLTGKAEAMREGKVPFVLAEGTVPINLALRGVTGSRFPTNREIALRINADSLPLDLIPQVSEYVTNIRGRASGNFSIAGTLNKPRLNGHFALREGSARIIPAGINLRGIEASIRMLRDTIVIDSIVGNSKGRLALYGGIGVASLAKPSFDLKFQAQNAQVLDSHLGQLRASADLAMVGPFSDPHVTGAIRIREGVVYIPPSDNKNLIGAGDPALFSVIDTSVMANRELFPASSPLFGNLRMDVNLRVDRDVFVRSREANVEVYSDGDLGIHVNRAKRSIVLDGVLLSERGEYRFLTRRFNIKRGSATFINSQELNPTLQVTGEYEVRQPAREAINIRILIGGTLRTPNISLESDAQPPIPQSDLLSYLAFGRSSSSLVQLEGSGLTSGSGGDNVVGAGAALASRQLAGVAIGVMADQFAGEAARSLGADVFTITPADVQTDVGSFLRATQFEFGKYIKSHTFVAVQSRLDPAALVRPGLQLTHRFGGLRGYRLETGLETRYLLREPTLSRDQNVATTSVLGLFLIREWRF